MDGKDGKDGQDGKDGKDAASDAETIFNILTANGTRFGGFTDPNDPNTMYINANYIRVGKVSLTGDGIKLGNFFIEANDNDWKINGVEIKDGTVTADKIQANSITSNHIQAGSIKAASLDTGCITADKIHTDVLGGWNLTKEGMVSKYGADKFYMYAHGSLGCETVTAINLDVPNSLEIGSDGLLITPFTKGAGGLDLYLESLTNRIIKLEGGTVPDKCTHSWDDGVETKAATCTTTGVKVRTCTKCGDTKNQTIDSLGHKWNPAGTGVCIRTGCGAVCNHGGATSGTCSTCKYVISSGSSPGSGGTTDPCANGHSWNNGVTTTAATCKSAGVKTYSCTNCTETKTEVIEKLPHSWDSGRVTLVASCTNGNRRYTCTVCGATRDETIFAVGHIKYTYSDTLGATCTQTGTRTWYCTCGTNMGTETLDAPGHDWNHNSVASTCNNCDTSCGHRRMTNNVCPTCGYTKTS
jgi:predicted peroxiredoxin